MPTYDYKCPKCNRTYEVIAKCADEGRETKCVYCFVDLVKQVSKPAVHFKGSGFYETDYKNK